MSTGPEEAASTLPSEGRMATIAELESASSSSWSALCCRSMSKVVSTPLPATGSAVKSSASALFSVLYRETTTPSAPESVSL
ncbi:hypothetical protein D3C74_417800 [compost metagenome]